MKVGGAKKRRTRKRGREEERRLLRVGHLSLLYFYTKRKEKSMDQVNEGVNKKVDEFALFIAFLLTPI